MNLDKKYKELQKDYLAEIKRILKENFDGCYKLEEDDEYDILYTEDDFGIEKWKLKEIALSPLDIVALYENDNVFDAPNYYVYGNFIGLTRLEKYRELLMNKIS